MIVGLTGSIGSGKSTAAATFAELGIDVIDADTIAREVVLPGSPALAHIHQRFGDEILLAEHLNRAKLREIIFQNPSEKTLVRVTAAPFDSTRDAKSVRRSFEHLSYFRGALVV